MLQNSLLVPVQNLPKKEAGIFNNHQIETKYAPQVSAYRYSELKNQTKGQTLPTIGIETSYRILDAGIDLNKNLEIIKYTENPILKWALFNKLRVEMENFKGMVRLLTSYTEETFDFSANLLTDCRFLLGEVEELMNEKDNKKLSQYKEDFPKLEKVKGELKSNNVNTSFSALTDSIYTLSNSIHRLVKEKSLKNEPIPLVLEKTPSTKTLTQMQQAINDIMSDILNYQSRILNFSKDTENFVQHVKQANDLKLVQKNLYVRNMTTTVDVNKFGNRKTFPARAKAIQQRQNIISNKTTWDVQVQNEIQTQGQGKGNGGGNIVTNIIGGGIKEPSRGNYHIIHHSHHKSSPAVIYPEIVVHNIPGIMVAPTTSPGPPQVGSHVKHARSHSASISESQFQGVMPTYHHPESYKLNTSFVNGIVIFLLGVSFPLVLQKLQKFFENKKN